MDAQDALAIDSEFLDAKLDFAVDVSANSIINSFDIVKFLLKSLKELSVFVVGKDSFVTVLQKVCAFINSVTSSSAD